LVNKNGDKHHFDHSLLQVKLLGLEMIFSSTPCRDVDHTKTPKTAGKVQIGLTGLDGIFTN